jgi:agmatine deiminase
VVGTEGQVTFWGNSFVTNAFGKILKKSGIREETLIVDVDISQNARIREGWRFSKNRRPDTYGPLTEPVRPDLPVRDGYSMPAEWEKHDAVWLAWPEDRVTFPNRIERVRKRFIEIIAQLTTGEDVCLAVRSNEVRSNVSSLLKKAGVAAGRVRFFRVGLRGRLVSRLRPDVCVSIANYRGSRLCSGDSTPGAASTRLW